MNYNEIFQEHSNSNETLNLTHEAYSTESSSLTSETFSEVQLLQETEDQLPVLLNREDSAVLLYPSEIEVSTSASFMARVTAPQTDPGKARFTMTSDPLGVFNITRRGGIVFVMRQDLLKAHPASKITIEVDWKEHRQQIQVTLKSEETSCREGDEYFCSRHDNQEICEASCGVGSKNSRCKWRPHRGSDLISKVFATCVPDLEFCSDQICDPLESLGSSIGIQICPQDCSRQVVGNVNTKAIGISASSKGNVCTCDDNEVCFCGPTVRNELEIATPKEVVTSTETLTTTENSMITTIIGLIPSAPEETKCGFICLAAAVGLPFIFFVLLLAFLLIYSMRNNRELHLRTFSLSDSTSNKFICSEAKLEMVNETSKLVGFPDFYSRRWELEMSNVKVGDVIGEGEFGKVMLAKIHNVQDRSPTTVVIKTVKNIDNESELTSLKREFEQLQKVSIHPHLNVIRLIGCNSKGEAPLIFLEFCVFESLKDYLMASRLILTRTGSDVIDKVTAEDILRYSYQIANGMSHLAEMKLVHRDLAARNVLLSEKKICKISDFGLSRNVCNSCDVYSKSSDDKVPVKWMAPESLSSGEEYTIKSDVWSFGILGYELLMLGGSPYPSMVATSHAEFFALLIQGSRMQCPPNCSPKLFAVFESCWAIEPTMRPTFAELVKKLELFHSSSPTQLWSTPEFSSEEMLRFDYDFYKNYIERVQRALLASRRDVKRRISLCERRCNAEGMSKSLSAGLWLPLRRQQKQLKSSQSMSLVNNSGYDSSFDSIKSLRMRQYENELAQALSEDEMPGSNEVCRYLPMNPTPLTSSNSLDVQPCSLSTFLNANSTSYIFMSQMLSKGTSSSSAANSVDITSASSSSQVEESPEEIEGKPVL